MGSNLRSGGRLARSMSTESSLGLGELKTSSDAAEDSGKNSAPSCSVRGIEEGLAAGGRRVGVSSSTVTRSFMGLPMVGRGWGGDGIGISGLGVARGFLGVDYRFLLMFSIIPG